MAPIILFLFYATMSVTTPNYNNIGKSGGIYFYPLYATFELMTLHTLGTWLWVYTNIWVAIVTLNSKFNDRAYKYICDGSLWCYASHYMFIIIIAFFVVRPLGLSFIPGFILMFFGTEFIVMITWIFMVEIPRAFKPKKNTKNDSLAKKGFKQAKFESEDRETLIQSK